jgi:Collagen triple helix repeat (20 copies)
MIVAVVALIVALGGTGYAALKPPKRSVGTAQLKKNAVTSPKVRDGALLARDFAPGQLPAGERGPAGAQGAQGERGLAGADGTDGTNGTDGVDGDDGADGATGSALLTGQATGIPGATSPVVGWTGVDEIGTFQGGAGDDTDSMSLSPARNLTLRNLSVHIRNDLPEGGSITFQIVAKPLMQFTDNGGDTVIGCTVVGTAGADFTCTAAGPGALPASRLIFMRITVGSTGVATPATRAFWGVSAEPAP